MDNEHEDLTWLDKVKKHLSDNKTVYLASVIGLSSGLAIGGAIGYSLRSSGGLVAIANHFSPFAKIEGVQVVIQALGDPGNIVQCVETGTVYASQNQAAKAMGVNRGTMSGHLNGGAPHVKNLHFVRLGKAEVPSAKTS